MLEHAIYIVGAKFVILCGIVMCCERQQARPYYYLLEIILGSAVLAFVPLIGQVFMYCVAAYQLRNYPYGTVRALLWPIELYRAAHQRLFRRYPFRRY